MGEVPEREDGSNAGEQLDSDGDDIELDDDGDGDGDGNAADTGGRAGGGERAADGRDTGSGELLEADDDERSLPPIERDALVEVLEFLAKSLVANPDKVAVQIVDRDGGVTLRLSVDQPDMGKVIGRSGRTARALRTLMRAAGTRAGLNTYVEIVEE
jgi:predicted RNA-binding protein YlqC (UPF0109 family)